MTGFEDEAGRGLDRAARISAGRTPPEENAMTWTAKARMTEAELAALADALVEQGDAGADRAEAAAASLDAALAELAAAPPPLDAGLRARMEAAAAGALAAAPVSASARPRPARDPRLAGAARRRPGLMARIGAPAAFAASAAMGVALGYSGGTPLAESFALLTTGYTYESAFLQADFLPDPDLPALEETR